MKNTIEKITNAVIAVEKKIMIIFIPVMCVTVFINTLSREFGVFMDKLVWAEEFSRYLMIWAAFIAAALATQKDEHYKMTAIVDACPKAVGNFLKVLAKLLTFCLLIILLVLGIKTVVKLYAMGQTSPTMKIPMWIPYLTIPFCMGMSILHFISREVLAFYDRRDSKKEAEE